MEQTSKKMKDNNWIWILLAGVVIGSLIFPRTKYYIDEDHCTDEYADILYDYDSQISQLEYYKDKLEKENRRLENDRDFWKAISEM